MAATPMPENPPGRPDPRPLLERPDLKPEDRRRIGRALIPVLGWGLAATALLGLLTLWHLIRRGRILRANLPPPKLIPPLEIDEKPDR